MHVVVIIIMLLVGIVDLDSELDHQIKVMSNSSDKYDAYLYHYNI